MIATGPVRAPWEPYVQPSYYQLKKFVLKVIFILRYANEIRRACHWAHELAVVNVGIAAIADMRRHLPAHHANHEHLRLSDDLLNVRLSAVCNSILPSMALQGYSILPGLLGVALRRANRQYRGAVGFGPETDSE